jgi:hypothetical protein
MFRKEYEEQLTANSSQQEIRKASCVRGNCSKERRAKNGELRAESKERRVKNVRRNEPKDERTKQRMEDQERGARFNIQLSSRGAKRRGDLISEIATPCGLAMTLRRSL